MAITHSTTEPILHPTHHLPIFSLSNHYLYTFFSLLFFSRELIDSEAGDIYHKTCGAGDPPYSRENLLLTYHFRYCCPKRTTHAIVNRKSKFIRFRECFRRGVQTQSKRENRHKGVKRRRAMTYGPFTTMYACRTSSARVAPTAAGRHDEADPGRSLGLPWRWWRA